MDGAYLLPGLWNNPSHLGGLLPDTNNRLKNQPLLHAGRNAFDQGVWSLQAIIPSGNPITDAEDDDWLSIRAKGAEDVSRLAEQHIANGAEYIKIKAGALTADEVKAAIDTAKGGILL